MTRHDLILMADKRQEISVSVPGHPDNANMPDLNQVRQAMFSYQQFTEADEIAARTQNGAAIARLTFEWADDE
jgi:hypothetical protein